MKDIIVNAYQWILYIGMALWIFMSSYGGYNTMSFLGAEGGLGAILGLLFGIFTAVFFLGFIFIILQIRDLLQDLVNIHKSTTQQ